MSKSTEKRTAEVKAGIFIVASLALLIFALLWLRYFAVMPEMSIKAKFDNPGALSKGLIVYYKGVNIGKVSRIYFSDDFRYTILDLDLYRKGLKLPSNIYAAIELEGITGQKHVSLVYPDKPSNKILANGATIEGQAPFDINDLQKYFAEQVRTGKLQKMFDNASSTLANADQMSIKINKAVDVLVSVLKNNQGDFTNLIKQGSEAATNFNVTTKGLNTIVNDPQVKTGIRNTIHSSGVILDNINEFTGDGELRKGIKTTIKNFSSFGSSMKSSGTSISQLGSFVGNFNTFLEEVNRTNLIENTGITVNEANKLLTQANCYLGQTGGGVDFKNLVVGTIQNTNQAAKRIDCVSNGVSDMFSKRFPLFRLLFGKPGASLEKCKIPNSPPPNQKP